jgi:hypothetical protein
MFFHNHGGDGSMWFPWGANNNSQNLVASECAGSWGDKDVEWIGIDTCLTLNDVVGYAACMAGVHVIAGFRTVSWGSDWGTDWTDELLGSSIWLPIIGTIWLRTPKTITQSWFTVCDDSQPAGTIARVIAEEPGHFNDKVWTRGGPALGDVTPGWPRYYIDHACYKPPARQVDVDALSAAPVKTYVVDPREVTQTYAQGVADTLGLEGTVQCPPGGTECGLVTTQGGQSLTLSIETASGGFVMQNTDQLWTGQDPTAPLTLPTEDAALALAGSYMDVLAAEALPGAANLDRSTAHYEQDKQTEVMVQATAAGPVEILQAQGVDVLVAYGRTLDTGVATASGAMINVGTVGPGSATKVYYGGSSAALRGPNQEQLPIALSGGTRDVNEGSGTTTKAYDVSWTEFLADRQLAVIGIPLDWDTAERVGQTFSYYEQPQGVPQKELIPVWVFTADLYKGTELVADDAKIYVPANGDYYPPGITIDAPTANSSFTAGQWVDLKATTAPESGYGPFTYEWSSSTQGTLYKGSQEDVKVMLLGKSDKEGGSTPVSITVKVTNLNGQSRTAEVIVNVVGKPQWLPLVTGTK